MSAAITRSGYLLEQRVEQVLSKAGFYVETNPVFPDPETGKSRELDISALGATSIYKKGMNFIFPALICECENNAQPVVFFTRESPISFLHHYEVRVSGVPVKFWQKDGYINLSDFTGMEKFHHYCKGKVATQYCTFQLKKDRSSWLALHDETQHDTFNSVIKALDYEISKHFDNWRPPTRFESEDVNVQIYYPLVILQGDLYTAELKSKTLVLKKVNHVQFRKEVFSSSAREVHTYQIDVISEKYLPKFLKIVESEVDKIKKVFQRKKGRVRLSIDHIVTEVKKSKKRKKSYRDILEF